MINNREKLKESETFIITLQKERNSRDSLKRRINVKILSLNEVLRKPYSKVTIELQENYNINEIKEMLSKSGETTINIIIKNKNQKAEYSLQKNRKFDLNHLKALKAKKYVAKITV